MARQEFELDGTFQQISAGVATFTIINIGDGSIEFADNSGGILPYVRSSSQIKNGSQFLQNEAIPTYAKGNGWKVITDGELPPP